MEEMATAGSEDKETGQIVVGHWIVAFDVDLLKMSL